MSNFELKYHLGTDYDEKVELEIRLPVKPSSEDITELSGAIETIDLFARKYLALKPKEVVKNG